MPFFYAVCSMAKDYFNLYLDKDGREMLLCEHFELETAHKLLQAVEFSADLNKKIDGTIKIRQVQPPLET